MKSPKEISTEKKLLELAKENEFIYKLINILIEDEEIEAYQEHANTVSIVRLGSLYVRIVFLLGYFSVN